MIGANPGCNSRKSYQLVFSTGTRYPLQQQSLTGKSRPRRCRTGVLVCWNLRHTDTDMEPDFGRSCLHFHYNHTCAQVISNNDGYYTFCDAIMMLSTVDKIASDELLIGVDVDL